MIPHHSPPRASARLALNGSPASSEIPDKAMLRGWGLTWLLDTAGKGPVAA